MDRPGRWRVELSADAGVGARDLCGPGRPRRSAGTGHRLFERGVLRLPRCVADEHLCLGAAWCREHGGAVGDVPARLAGTGGHRRGTRPGLGAVSRARHARRGCRAGHRLQRGGCLSVRVPAKRALQGQPVDTRHAAAARFAGGHPQGGSAGVHLAIADGFDGADLDAVGGAVRRDGTGRLRHWRAPRVPPGADQLCHRRGFGAAGGHGRRRRHGGPRQARRLERGAAGDGHAGPDRGSGGCRTGPVDSPLHAGSRGASIGSALLPLGRAGLRSVRAGPVPVFLSAGRGKGRWPCAGRYFATARGGDCRLAAGTGVGRAVDGLRAGRRGHGRVRAGRGACRADHALG